MMRMCLRRGASHAFLLSLGLYSLASSLGLRDERTVMEWVHRCIMDFESQNVVFFRPGPVRQTPSCTSSCANEEQTPLSYCWWFRAPFSG